MKPEKAKRRAPGPGPIRKRDWAPKASRWLKHRRVILHTDGARSYKLKIDGVLHDWVVRKKKRVKLGGKWVWLKPAFTKIRYHNVPDQSKPRGTKRLWVKCGTQVIDRAWGELRRAVGKGKVKEVNSAFLRNKVGGRELRAKLMLALAPLLISSAKQGHCARGALCGRGWWVACAEAWRSSPTRHASLSRALWPMRGAFVPVDVLAPRMRSVARDWRYAPRGVGQRARSVRCPTDAAERGWSWARSKHSE